MAYINALMQHLRHWVQCLRPAPTGIGHRERLRIIAGVALGLFLTGLLSQSTTGSTVDHFQHGSFLGATTLLLFALPSSPFAQPWAVIVGNLSAAAVGMVCSLLIQDVLLAAAIAVPLAIWVMMALRAVHPPGAGLTLYVVLLHLHDPRLLLFPFLLSLVTLTAFAALYHRATGKQYPHRQLASPASATPSKSFTSNDLDEALSRYNEVLAISREDLAELLTEVNGAAFQRHLGELRCEHIMTKHVHSVPSDLQLSEVWSTLRASHSRMLPVVDGAQHFVGMIGLDQWLDALEKQQEKKREKAPMLAQLRRWAGARKNTDATTINLLVRDAMVPSLAIARADQPVMDLIPMLCQGGLYLVPVIDTEHQLVGIISQTDLLRALNVAIAEP